MIAGWPAKVLQPAFLSYMDVIARRKRRRAKERSCEPVA